MTSKHILTILFLLPFGFQTSLACDCLETKSVRESIKQSDIVIVGQVISQETWYFNNDLDSGLYVNSRRPGNYVEAQSRFQLIVTSKFKGEFKVDTLTIVTSYGEESCGYEFEIGKTYIIYGSSEIEQGYERKGKLPSTFGTTLCTRTRPLDQSELSEIKKLTGR